MKIGEPIERKLRKKAIKTVKTGGKLPASRTPTKRVMTGGGLPPKPTPNVKTGGGFPAKPIPNVKTGGGFPPSRGAGNTGVVPPRTQRASSVFDTLGRKPRKGS